MCIGFFFKKNSNLSRVPPRLLHASEESSGVKRYYIGWISKMKISRSFTNAPNPFTNNPNPFTNNQNPFTNIQTPFRFPVVPTRLTPSPTPSMTSILAPSLFRAGFSRFVLLGWAFRHNRTPGSFCLSEMFSGVFRVGCSELEFPELAFPKLGLSTILILLRSSPLRF